MPTKTHETKVRDYLAFLSDPSTAVDEANLARAQKAFDQCQDPIEALTLYRDLQKAKDPDGDALEADFIKVVKAWADQNGIEGEIFEKVHEVPKSVLSRAGFGGFRNTEYKERTSGGIVQTHVRRLGKGRPFTVKDVAEDTDASLAGVRNVLKEMVEQGEIEILPKDDTIEYAGRPPVRYART